MGFNESDHDPDLRKKMGDWQNWNPRIPGMSIPKAIVDVKLQDGGENYNLESWEVNWGYYGKGTDVVAYRICPVQEKPHYKVCYPKPINAGPFREKNSAERKGEPIHAGVLRYFPDALAAVARLSKAGNDKHNPGQPLHWSRHKSNDHLDCVARHIITPDKPDPDSGESHLVHAAWRVLAALQLQEEERLAKAGIENLSGVKTDGKSDAE
jgi:hypothetical protein